MKRHYQSDEQCQRCSDIYLMSTHLHGRRTIPVSDSWAAETWTQWPQREATDISPAFQGQKHVISWIWKKKLPEASKCVCPAWCWITQSLKRLKRDGGRGNEPNNKVNSMHQNISMLFMDTRLHRSSDRFLTLSKKEDNILFLLRQLHVPFLSQQRTVQNMHFIKDVHSVSSAIDRLHSRAVEEFTQKSCSINTHTHRSESELSPTETCMSTPTLYDLFTCILDMYSIWIKRLYRYLTATAWNNTSMCVPTAYTFLSAQLRGRHQTALSPHEKKRCSTYSRDTEHTSRCCPVSAAISPSLSFSPSPGVLFSFRYFSHKHT